MKIRITIFSLLSIVMCACGQQAATKPSDTSAEKAQRHVEFNADSAYAFVAQQVAFGPRVPGSAAHRECADWLVEKLRSYGAENIVEQHIDLQAYDGTKLPSRNITASFNPSAQRRILLLSHWDSRPWADHDPDASKRAIPIDGANDGASGVGVILEIARNLAANTPSVGVDILFTDAEDAGTRADSEADDNESSWCLGTQYWVENPTLDLSKIRYAILLDMVGGKDAVFDREYFSQRNAGNINDKVWKAAAKAGYGERFISRVGAPIIDDHIYLIKAGIPAIDIIETSNPATGGFNPTWHTHADNIDNIDPVTLKAVGQTLHQLIYNE